MNPWENETRSYRVSIVVWQKWPGKRWQWDRTERKIGHRLPRQSFPLLSLVISQDLDIWIPLIPFLRFHSNLADRRVTNNIKLPAGGTLLRISGPAI